MNTTPVGIVATFSLLTLAVAANAQHMQPLTTAAVLPPVELLAAPDMPPRTVMIAPTGVLAPDHVPGIHPKLVGFAEPVNADVRDALVWQMSPAGDWICRIEITSFNATGLRIGIAVADAQSNTEVRIYDPVSGYVFASEHPAQFGGAAGWWSPEVSGESIGVEFVSPRRGDGLLLPPPAPVISSIGRFQPEFTARELGCHVDVNCYSFMDAAKSGVVKITYVEPSQLMYQCSASILNRSSNDMSAIVLTAAHCIDGDYAAQTMRAIFNYNSTACDSGIGSNQNTQAGPGFLLRRIPNEDISIVGLLQPVPSGVTFLGWTVDAIVLSHPFMWGIHHPGGTYKRMWRGTFSDTGIRSFAGISNPVSVWITNIDSDGGGGAVEPGSPGSPLLHNQFGDGIMYVRGPLTGGSGACGGMEADFGRFDLAFSFYDQFLANVPNSVWLSPAGIFGDRGTTQQHAFGSIYEAYFCVASGGQVNILSGSYHDRPTFTRPMTLRAINGPVTIGN